jgi:hypothetical protein
MSPQSIVRPSTATPARRNLAPSTSLSSRYLTLSTKKKTKMVTFQFTANEQLATFECSVDQGPFVPCTSPHRVWLPIGRHTFTVRARDSFGAVDATPPTDSFVIQKVKKKKKKRRN